MSSHSALSGSIAIARRRRLLATLWRGGWPLSEIAEIYGGTPQGVRSTVRKMRERGELPDRPQPIWRRW